MSRPHVDLFHVTRQRHAVLVNRGVTDGACSAAGSVFFGRRFGLCLTFRIHQTVEFITWFFGFWHGKSQYLNNSSTKPLTLGENDRILA
jgi:hypothetical protein